MDTTGTQSHGKIYVKDLSEYNALQRQEMLEGDNRWFAFKALKVDPTPHQRVWHYIEHRGPDDFARRYAIQGMDEDKSNTY